MLSALLPHKAALSDRQDIFRAIADRSPQPMLITNERVEIEYVNPAWIKEFGYRLEEVCGKNPRMFQSGKTPPEVHKRMWAALKAGKTFQSDEVIDKRKDGTYFNLMSTVFPVRTSDGLHYVQMLNDITAAKRIAEFRRHVMSAAAHDIRTPLQNLQVIVDTETLVGDGSKAPALQQEISKVDALTRALLDTSQLDEGAFKLHISECNLPTIVQEALNSANGNVGRVRYEGPTDLSVRVDPDRIQQALTNLIQNALKYGDSHHAVQISVAVNEREVTVAVADRGPGIQEHEQSKLFDPLYRTDGAKKSAQPGSGLGLYIVREIIGAHGGHLWVESELGVGSTFSFSIPLENLKEIQ